MSIFLTSLKLERDNISHLKVIISHMFVRHFMLFKLRSEWF